MNEPEIAIVTSPREWAQRLHRHVADHGGARVRATVLNSHDAIMEHYDVLVIDDTTSFLSSRFVAELHQRGRRVLGVCDPQDETGAAELDTVGADGIVLCTADPEDFLDVIARLVPAPLAPSETTSGEPAPDRTSARGRITVVGGPPGGSGVTEVAIGLATAIAGRQERCVLVDGDEEAPALAQRLALPPYPNLPAMIEAVQRQVSLDGFVQPFAGGLVHVLAGTLLPGSWTDLRPADIHALVDTLTDRYTHVIIDSGHRPWPVGGRGTLSPAGRAVVEAADVLVGVAHPTPVGITRLGAWAAGVETLNTQASIHIVLNRTPLSQFKRSETKGEVAQQINPASITFAPIDGRVEAAAWTGGVVGQGQFVRAMRQVADIALPSTTPATGQQPRSMA